MSETPKTYNYDLWKHMHDEHGLTLLESELSEIEDHCEAVKILTESRRHFCEQLQQVAEAVGMPVANGNAVAARVRELVAENEQLRKKLHRATQLFGSLTMAYRKLSEAAQAVVDRWETPLWKDAEPTAAVIYKLRDLLGNKTNDR